jgi:hypothetical protein
VTQLRAFLTRYDVGTILVRRVGYDPGLVLTDLTDALGVAPSHVAGLYVWSGIQRTSRDSESADGDTPQTVLQDPDLQADPRQMRQCGGGGIRTLTGDGLSALPLPVGLRPRYPILDRRGTRREDGPKVDSSSRSIGPTYERNW